MAILQKESRDHNGETGAIRTDSQVIQGYQHQARLALSKKRKDPNMMLTWGKKLFVIYQMEAHIMFGTPTMTQRPKQHWHNTQKMYAIQTDARSTGA
jgi:hypothetical protein